MTAWVRGRTSWLSKPPMQSKRSAASGCTSAAARWVWISLLHLLKRSVSPVWAHLSALSINAFFPIICLNRSRLSPSARFCRPLLTALWHQTSPEARGAGGCWDLSKREKKQLQKQWIRRKPWLHRDCQKIAVISLFFLLQFSWQRLTGGQILRVFQVSLQENMIQAFVLMVSPVETELLWICLNHFLGICFLYLTCSCTCHVKSTCRKKGKWLHFLKTHWNTAHSFQQCHVNESLFM